MDTFFGLHVVILALLSLFGDGHVCTSTVVCVSLGNTSQCYELKVQLIPMDVEIHILECDVIMVIPLMIYLILKQFVKKAIIFVIGIDSHLYALLRKGNQWL